MRIDYRECVVFLLFLGVILGLSACAGIGSTGSGTAVSTATSIPEDVKVCGFLTPSEVKGALGFTARQMSYYHVPGSGYGSEVDSTEATLSCNISPISSDDPIATMWYEPRGSVDKVVPMAATDSVPVFDDVKGFDGVEGFSIDSVEGEGLTLIDKHRSIAMWHYPDDHVLIVEIEYLHSEDVIDQRLHAKALLEQSVIRVVDQANKPAQELTGYPSDSAAPGIDYATPNSELG